MKGATKSKHGRDRLGLKAISVFVSFCLVFTQGSFTFAQGPALTAAPGMQSPLTIPQSLGKISERFALNTNAPTSDNPLLIRIEDAHSVFSSQVKIRELLNYLYETYDLKLILLEGGYGELNANTLALFEQDSLNDQLINSLMETSEIGGAEAFLHEKRHADVQSFGVESKELYWQNVRDYRRVLEAGPKSKAFLVQLEKQINLRASHHLKPQLREFLKEWLLYDRHSLEGRRFLSVLEKYSAQELAVDLRQISNQNAWPQLVRFFEVQSLEKEVTMTKVRAEKKKLAAWMKEKQLSADYLAAIENLVAGQTPPRGARHLMETFYEQAGPHGFQFSDYPALSQFLASFGLSHEIDGQTLNTEINHLSYLILDRLAETKPAKTLVELSKKSALLEKLFTLELTRADFREIQNRSPDFQPASLLKTLRELGGETASTASAKDSNLNLMFEHAINFYHGALLRDQALADNALQIIQQTGAVKAALITGGFHSQGLSEHFQKKGIAYTNIVPNMPKVETNAQYHQVVAGRMPEGELAHSKIKSALYFMGRPPRPPQGSTPGDNLAAQVAERQQIILADLMASLTPEPSRSEARETDTSVLFKNYPDDAFHHKLVDDAANIVVQRTENQRGDLELLLRTLPKENYSRSLKILVNHFHSYGFEEEEKITYIFAGILHRNGIDVTKHRVDTLEHRENPLENFWTYLELQKMDHAANPKEKISAGDFEKIIRRSLTTFAAIVTDAIERYPYHQRFVDANEGRTKSSRRYLRAAGIISIMAHAVMLWAMLRTNTDVTQPSEPIELQVFIETTEEAPRYAPQAYIEMTLSAEPRRAETPPEPLLPAAAQLTRRSSAAVPERAVSDLEQPDMQMVPADISAAPSIRRSPQDLPEQSVAESLTVPRRARTTQSPEPVDRVAIVPEPLDLPAVPTEPKEELVPAAAQITRRSSTMDTFKPELSDMPKPEMSIMPAKISTAPTIKRSTQDSPELAALNSINTPRRAKRAASPDFRDLVSLAKPIDVPEISAPEAPKEPTLTAAAALTRRDVPPSISEPKKLDLVQPEIKAAPADFVSVAKLERRTPEVPTPTAGFIQLPQSRTKRAASLDPDKMITAAIPEPIDIPEAGPKKAPEDELLPAVPALTRRDSSPVIPELKTSDLAQPKINIEPPDIAAAPRVKRRTAEDIPALTVSDVTKAPKRSKKTAPLGMETVTVAALPALGDKPAAAKPWETAKAIEHPMGTFALTDGKVFKYQRITTIKFTVHLKSGRVVADGKDKPVFIPERSSHNSRSKAEHTISYVKKWRYKPILDEDAPEFYTYTLPLTSHKITFGDGREIILLPFKDDPNLRFNKDGTIEKFDRRFKDPKSLDRSEARTNAQTAYESHVIEAAADPFELYAPGLINPRETVVQVSGGLYRRILPAAVAEAMLPSDYRSTLQAMGFEGYPKQTLMTPEFRNLLGLSTAAETQNDFGMVFLPLVIDPAAKKRSLEQIELALNMLLVTLSEYPNKVGGLVLEGELPAEDRQRLEGLVHTALGGEKPRAVIINVALGDYTKSVSDFFQGNWKGDAQNSFQSLHRSLSYYSKRARLKPMPLPGYFQYASVIAAPTYSEDALTQSKWLLSDETSPTSTAGAAVSLDRMTALALLGVITAGQGANSELKPEFLKASLILENLKTSFQPNYQVMAWLKSDAALLGQMDQLRAAAQAIMRAA